VTFEEAPLRFRVFAYGTLQIADVMEAVTGRVFPSEPAVLDGYERRRVKGRSYPGVTVAPGRCTRGLLYADVDARSMELLDRFEGALYERRRVPVTTNGRTRVEAEVYVVPESRRDRLSAEAWDPDRFAAEQLASFVQSCRDFHRREGGRK
jgi:gamma-glutamylcyclotransferase (GGCT)/AIG2-like uncharacterized protein YtfP